MLLGPGSDCAVDLQAQRRVSFHTESCEQSDGSSGSSWFCCCCPSHIPWTLTCAAVCLLAVNLQQDQSGEEQQPAPGPVWGLLQRGPYPLRGREQDPARATEPGTRRMQERGGCAGGERAAGGGRVHGQTGSCWFCLLLVLSLTRCLSRSVLCFLPQMFVSINNLVLAQLLFKYVQSRCCHSACGRTGSAHIWNSSWCEFKLFLAARKLLVPPGGSPPPLCWVCIVLHHRLGFSSSRQRAAGAAQQSDEQKVRP